MRASTETKKSSLYTSMMRYKRIYIRILIVIVLLLIFIVVPDISSAILAPFLWIFDLWGGNPNIPLHDQIPVVGSSNHIGNWAGLAGACAVGVYVGGYLIGRPHYPKRIAMILVGVSWYLFLVASPWTYSWSRQLIGLSAFICIFCARLLKRYFKPIKTVLFFIGIGFTAQALAWALADPKATIVSAALFSITSAFFTRIDKKRRNKTRITSAAGLLVFIISLGAYIEAPMWIRVITIAFGVSRVIHMIHIYGNPDGSFTSTFDSNPVGLTDICYPHIEMHGERGSRIVYHAPELKVVENLRTGLTMFRISSVFGDTSSVLLGFGTPNTAITLYDHDAKTWRRLNSFMFFRQESFISKVDELQVGLYVELRGLSEEVRSELFDAMKNNSGMRDPTCAHAAANTLADVGFSFGGSRKLRSVYRPSHFASNIWAFGLMHDGKPVDMRIVNTSKLEVRDQLVGVWGKEITSPIRLVSKVFHSKSKKNRPKQVSTQEQLVKVRKENMWTGVPVTIQMSRPNVVGTLLTLIWGRHVEFRVSVEGLKLHPALATPLTPFPGQLSWISKVKKHILFSRPVVTLINEVKNKAFDRYDGIPVSAAIEMMSPTTSADERVLWNFAVIEVGDTYEFRLSPLKNQDPKSKNSKFRRVANWILVKHVVATGYSERTVYAGEGYAHRKSGSHELTICINNNSGTYKPTVEQLEFVGDLIRGFGVNIETQVYEG